ncbi:prephenate dehydrogenase/arogenate dehydrogenase family protein [Rubrobacter taiwanensis]|jgi:prephenate dehydrogenase|uniref:Prephenate dehydrogenase n=1 Tax=Rubrobacter taiwanensis TaxID=185139 RepID=A0A4R1BSE0_9ACTN|nr:prephenate dehydrogenase/arogenate dehydrogenase family protein [Rubrobacter taiwanensis]TCJ20749.1 prephenate dehydrogenase/arogenate dehydrogenase family protein [Rubrobacter taiwanensis]
MSGTLGIVGVGLIGGSIGLAARKSGWEVVGVDRAEVLERAAALGAIDRASTLKEARGADLVILAAPISQSTRLLGELAPTDAPVTDVASVKMPLVEAAERAGLRYVGGHPMAGSQLSGVNNADADLFRGARYFLTPTERTDPEVYRRVSAFVRDTLRATPTAVPPEKHDLLMAALSHLPHLMAVALLKVASDISPEALSFAGPSFRDLTRVGASNPELWADILAANAPALGEALGAFAGAMAQIGSEIGNRGAIEERFRRARDAYEELGGILLERKGKNVELAVPLENQPGALARVTTLLGSRNINILDLYMRHSHTERAALVLTLSSAQVKEARAALREAGFGAEILD